MPRLFPRTLPSQSIAVSRGSCHGGVHWRPHLPHPIHARYVISCHLMYTHTPVVLQPVSQHSKHQSTARIRVPSGPFGLAAQALLFEDFFSNFFRQGGNARNLFDFDNQSARFFCVDTIKYYPIANVPSGLEGVNTRSHRQTIRTHPTIPTQPRLKVFALTRIA